MIMIYFLKYEQIGVHNLHEGNLKKQFINITMKKMFVRLSSNYETYTS